MSGSGDSDYGIVSTVKRLGFANRDTRRHYDDSSWGSLHYPINTIQHTPMHMVIGC